MSKGAWRRMGMRAVLLGALSLLAPAPIAMGEVEPNNRLTEAEGPLVGGQPSSGSISSENDSDWYFFYVSGQVELEVALMPTVQACSNGYLTLRDSDGAEVSKIYIDETDSENTAGASIRYTTPPGVTRYYIEAICYGEGTWTYQFTVGPALGIVDGARPFATPVLTPEPNESVSQAFGPLQGGIDYAGVSGTQNDEDWFYFYAHGGQGMDIAVTANVNGCRDGAVRLADSANADLFNDSTSVGAILNQVHHIRFTTPPGIRRYDLVATGCGVAGDYRFRIEPASAVSMTPAVAAPPPKRPTLCQRLRSARAKHTRRIGKLRAKRRMAVTRRSKRRYSRRIKIAKHRRAIVVQRMRLRCR